MPLEVRQANPESIQLPRTVGGRDAAPSEWDAWAEEPGHDLIALDGARAIGGLHVSLVGRSEAWLEMLRVLPEYRGRGVAAQLVREGEQVARKYGAGTVRTAVPAHEYAALGVAERAGFRRLLQCVVLEADLSPGPLHLPYDAPSRVPQGADAADVLRFAEQTQTLSAWEGLIPLGWRFRRITIEVVRGLIKDRRTAVAMQQNPEEAVLQGIAMFNVQEAAAIFSLIDGTPSGMQGSLSLAVETARDGMAERLTVFASDLHALDPLEIRSWTPHLWCPEGLIVVEKRLAS